MKIDLSDRSFNLFDIRNVVLFFFRALAILAVAIGAHRFAALAFSVGLCRKYCE